MSYGCQSSYQREEDSVLLDSGTSFDVLAARSMMIDQHQPIAAVNEDSYNQSVTAMTIYRATRVSAEQQRRQKTCRPARGLRIGGTTKESV